MALHLRNIWRRTNNPEIDRFVNAEVLSFSSFYQIYFLLRCFSRQPSGSINNHPIVPNLRTSGLKLRAWPLLHFSRVFHVPNLSVSGSMRRTKILFPQYIYIINKRSHFLIVTNKKINQNGCPPKKTGKKNYEKVNHHRRSIILYFHQLF